LLGVKRIINVCEPSKLMFWRWWWWCRYDNPVCSEQITATTQAQAQPGNGYIPGWMLWESCTVMKLTHKRPYIYIKY